MENHHSKLNEPGHLGIEMDVLEDKKNPTRQVSPFPGSAKRLSTNSQNSNGEAEGYQAVENIPSTQDKIIETRHDKDVRSGTYDLLINCSPVTSDNDGCNVQEGSSTRLFHRDIMETQLGGEETIDSGATANGSYFLQMHEIQFKSLSEKNAKRLNSIRRDSTQEFHRDPSDVNGERKHNLETTGDGSYFLPNYQLQLEDTIRDSTGTLAGSSKLKFNRRAKQHRESTGPDGGYWRRMFLNKDEVTSDDSSLEQGLPEAKRQWYRSRKMRPEYFRPLQNTNLEFWFIILAVIVIAIIHVIIFLLWAYFSISS